MGFGSSYTRTSMILEKICENIKKPFGINLFYKWLNDRHDSISNVKQKWFSKNYLK